VRHRKLVWRVLLLLVVVVVLLSMVSLLSMMVKLFVHITRLSLIR